MKRAFPLHMHISSLFMLLLLLVGGIIGGVGYKFSRDIIESSAVELTQRSVRETAGEFQQAVVPAETAVRLLSHDIVADRGSLKDALQRLPYYRAVLDSSVSLTSIYVGYQNGDFFMVRRIADEAERIGAKAPAATLYIVQSIEHSPAGGAQGRFLFLDAALTVLAEEDRPDYPASYDPRSRDWYRDAMATRKQIKTQPYLFFSQRKVGSTTAMQSRNGQAVVGGDILLQTLGQSLARQRITPGSLVVLANRAGQVLASEDMSKVISTQASPDAKPTLARLGDLGIPILASAGEIIAAGPPESGIQRNVALAEGDWRLAIIPVPLEGARPYLVIAIPDRELLAVAFSLRTRSALLTILIILLATPVVWAISRRIAGSLKALVGEAEAVRHFDFSRPSATPSMIVEVNELAQTMDGMKRTIRRFLAISQALGAEENFDVLMPMLLSETLSAADAEAGILYLADDGKLTAMAARTREGAAIDLGGPEIPLDAAGPVIGQAIRSSQIHAAALAADDIAALGLDRLAAAESARQGLAVPLINREQQLVGVMLLLRRTPIDSAQTSFISALSGSAASSLETLALIKAQKVLFESFIKMIAGAIDAKSPYTGGHCARVPELTKMLARAACAETSGTYKDFELDDRAWEAVHIAAWLHDCGKVTTPEFVVDKATKLETIYDRIHEVRMRFEVLKRDAEIACLKAIAAGESAAAARQRWQAETAQLDDDYAFIATCNEGGEFMAPEKLARLGSIATRTWLRTLDDRIGISHEEKQHRQRSPAPALPVLEPLLADKPEHAFERRPQDCLPTEQWGFRMDVPALLYNRGELHNLSVERGTLSGEERYKINEHIVQTIILLSQLPFPKHLRQVPEIAGGHHEKMDGTGYPKRLTRDQMSPVARMMAIADIFEALTAVDRPYKKGKTLSEAIKIMSFMVKDQHIDPELFALFLRSGVYRDYAVRFMKPEQIDPVDIGKHLEERAA